MSTSGHVFHKTLRDQRRSLVGWSLGMTALVLVEGALWPSVRDMPKLDEFLASYPEALRELFDLDAMSTGVGFLNAELFTLLVPALFIVFGISRGARLLAGEEEAGTLEILLVTPLSTTRILLEKAMGLLAAIGVLGLVCATATVVASAIFSMNVPLRSAVVGAVAVGVLGLEFGWLALAVGAVTGRRSVAVGVGGIAAVSAYVLYVAALLVDPLRDWVTWSPFHQALAEGPLAPTLPPHLAFVILGACLPLAIAPSIFARRDIRAV